jgi:immunity protein 51 of polymorphic toxin system
MAPAKKKGSSKPKPKAKAKAAAKPKKAQAKAKAKPKAKPKAKTKKPAAKKPKPQVEQVFAPAPAEPIAEGFEFSDDDLDGLSFMAESDAKPDASAFAPGILVEHDDGKFSVVYSKFPSSPDLEAVYDARGLQGGGYTWHGFVVHLMKQHAPQALDAVEFDPEGSMFCAVSKDLAALQAVSAALAQLENIELVKQLAATVDVSEYD